VWGPEMKKRIFHNYEKKATLSYLEPRIERMNSIRGGGKKKKNRVGEAVAGQKKKRTSIGGKKGELITSPGKLGYLGKKGGGTGLAQRKEERGL